MSWRVRRGTARDLEEVLRMERAIAELPHWPEVEYARYVAGEGLPADRLLLVAEREPGGELAGFAAAAAGPAPIGRVELESLGVVVEARRQGIARGLCDAVVLWSREREASEVDLEVRSRSAGAIALYRSLGFRAVGRRRGYYADPADDAVLLSLSL